MPRLRLSMRKIREVLRLLWEQKRSVREVAVSCNLARSTVTEYQRRAVTANLSWPLPDVDDAVLERLLFPPAPAVLADERVPPDWDEVNRELSKSKLVSRFLLWQEYRSVHPDGYSYTRFCELFKEWRGIQGLSMRQIHIAGDRVYVDYAGSTIPVVDLDTGEVYGAYVFVGSLGASHYTYAEATRSTTMEDWIGSHVRMLNYFGACPMVLVPDNLKTGVTSPHLYEPDINPTYLAFAQHYGLAVIPARQGHPKDKAIAESGVQVVGRRILARLRNRDFFGLVSVNDAIRELLTELNEQPFQKRPGSRKSLFVELDLPAMRPLPSERYVYAFWKFVRPHLNYHVTIDDHHYSVPHAFAGVQLEARISATTVELFSKNKRIASHVRSSKKGEYSTIREHMPLAHQVHADMNEEKILGWANNVGEAATAIVNGMLNASKYRPQAFKGCLGVLRLGKEHSDMRLEAACARAVKLRSFTYTSIRAILENRLESQPLETPAPSFLPRDPHENVRGGDYYSALNQTEQADTTPTLTNQTPESGNESC